MKRRTVLLAGGLLAAVLACAGFLLWQRSHAGAAVTAEIYQGGVLVESVRLDRLQSSRTLTLTGEDGGENVVELAPGRVRMYSANCPDQVCVRQGWISDASVPIVCLPHQVIIQVTGGDSYADAAAG